MKQHNEILFTKTEINKRMFYENIFIYVNTYLYTLPKKLISIFYA